MKTMSSTIVAWLLLAPASGAADPPALSVWTLDGLQRVRPEDPPREGHVARIRAARGEWEPFQVALRASGHPIRALTAEVSDLAGAGAAIPRGNIRLYREHFVYLRRPSARSEAAPGLYPDALLPFVDPA